MSIAPQAWEPKPGIGLLFLLVTVVLLSVLVCRSNYKERITERGKRSEEVYSTPQ